MVSQGCEVMSVNEETGHIYIQKNPRIVLCPICGKPCVDYDSTEREWRYLDFFQYEAHIHARVPRTNCKDHGIKTVNIPWSRKDASHGRLLEFHVIDLCREMSVSSASKLLGIGPDTILCHLNWCTSNKFVASIPTLVLLFSESYGHNWYLSNTLWFFLCLCFNEK